MYKQFLKAWFTQSSHFKLETFDVKVPPDATFQLNLQKKKNSEEKKKKNNSLVDLIKFWNNSTTKTSLIV